MPNGKLIRGLAALVMILALVLPVSPGFAAEQNDDGEVQAAHLAAGPGGNINTITTTTPVPTNFAIYDAADCPPTTEQASTVPGLNVGVARYVITVDNADASTTVQLIGTGGANAGQIVTMTRGDFENQAYDGTPCLYDANCPADLNTAQNPTGSTSAEHLACRLQVDQTATPPDGHANDFASAFIKSHNPDYGNAPNPALVGALPGPAFGSTGVNPPPSPVNNVTAAQATANTWTWDLLVSQGGFTPRRFNLSLVTDNRGARGFNGVTSPFIPAAPNTPAVACGTDNFACNIGLGTIIMGALPVQSGFGTVNGTVTDENGLPLANVTVVLTDANGSLHTTLTNANGFYSFPNTITQAATATSPFSPAVVATSGDFIPAGPATIVFADNINDYYCPSPPAFPYNCGHLPGGLAITVPGGAPVTASIQLTVKSTPSPAESTLATGQGGAFGYAVSNKLSGTAPQGVGGVRIDAFLVSQCVGGVVTPPLNACTGGTQTPVLTTTNTNVVPPTAGALPVASTFTDPGTGRWRIPGLIPGNTYTFAASNGSSTLTCATNAATPAEVTPANLAIGITAGLCLDTLTIPTLVAGQSAIWVDPVFVIALGNPFPVAVPPPGAGYISGVITDSQGLPVAGTTVTLYQLSSGRTWAVQTLPNGQYFFGQLAANPQCLATGAVGTAGTILGNLPAPLGSTGCAGLPFDTYTITAMDTRFPEQCIGTGVAVAGNIVPANTPCGGLPVSQQVVLAPNAANVNGSVATVNLAMPAKFAPGVTACVPGTAGCTTVGTTIPIATTLTTGTVGVFGYVVESAAGTRIPGAIVQFTPGTPNPVLGQVGTVACNTITGVVGCIQTTTDATGRYQVVLAPNTAYTAIVILPPGFTGACTVGAVGLCVTGATFTQFSVPATLTGGFWYDGGSFALAGSTVVSGVGNGLVPESLQAVILPIFRNPDTTFTGVDMETVQVRVMNNGPTRTGVRIDWWQTSSDEVASLAKSDGFDLNPGAVAIFTRTFVPDGCTRCYAEVYSVDLDLTGLNYGLSDLQATVTNRVVEADNAIAGHNGSTNEDMFQGSLNQFNTNLAFPPGLTTPVSNVINCIPGTFGCPTGINTSYFLPAVYKNYGGGANKWTSVVSACLTRGALTSQLTPGAVAGVNGTFTNPITGLPFINFSSGGQPIVFHFQSISGSTAPNGPFDVTRFAQPGGCTVINLNAPDPDNPDLGGVDILPTGAYAVTVTSTGGLLTPTQFQQGGVNQPNGFFTAAVSYTVTGKMAMSSNGTSALDTEGLGGANIGGATIRQLYGALVFKRYNDWNTGIVISNQPVVSGGSNADVTLTLYGEDGTVMGSFTDQIGGLSARVYYLPTLPIQLPDGFRGTAVVSFVNPASTFPTIQSGSNARVSAGAHHVNYERNQAISFNFYRQEALPLSASAAAGGTGTGEAQFVNPCYLTAGTTAGSVQPIQLPAGSLPLPGGLVNTAPITFGSVPNCLAAPAVERQVASDPVTRSEVPSGPTTGLRLFNPDVSRTGLSAFASVTYLDPSGVVQGNSITTVTIPALGSATIFLGADARLPDYFTGTAIILSDQPIIGIANVVDYGVRTRDGSWAYNLPNQRGFTS